MPVPQSSDNVILFAQPSGPRGPQGVIGPNGWAPILTYETGASGLGLYITDWTGGSGTKPAINIFVGAVSITVGVYVPVVAPASPSSGAVQYFDQADSILKIKFSNGSILELVP